MSIFSGIFNRTKMVSSKPMSTQTQATKQSTTIVQMSRGGSAKDLVEARETGQITPADVAELLSYSRSFDAKNVQYKLFPIDESSWEGDEFNKKYLTEKFLGPYPPGKNYFWQGIWGLPNPVMSIKMIQALMEETKQDGQGELCSKEWQNDARQDLSLWNRTQQVGTAHAIGAAYRLVANRTAALADKIALDKDVDSQTQPDVEGVQAHCAQVLNACREIQRQISQRHAARMQPVCERLRAACIRLVERQVEREERLATEDEIPFRSSPKLIALLRFAMLDKLGMAGWIAPIYNIVSLGCSLPPDPAPWGVELFQPSPESAEAQRIAKAGLLFSRTLASADKAVFMRKPDLSNIKL